MEEIVNEDFEKISSNIKIPDEAVIYLVVWKKLLKVKNPIYCGLRTNKVKSLKNSYRMKIF